MPARPPKTILLFIFLIAALLAIFFRVYPLLTPFFQQTLFRKIGGHIVSRAMVDQLKKKLDKQFPQMTEQEKSRLSKEEALHLAVTQKDQYEAAVQNATAQLMQSAAPASKRRYLLEADPYYYLYLTEQVAKTGRLSPQIKNGRYFHPLMHAPLGYWTAFVLHPYVGYFWYRFLSFLHPGIDMMEALSSFPVFLCVWVAALFLGLAMALERGALACFLGLVTLTLSPIFIQRSAFGWYDTDPYNYLFPFIILWFSISGIQRKGREIPFALAAAFFTGLYSLFWTGWAFIFLLLPSALLTVFLIMRWIPRFKKEIMLQRAAHFCLAYLFFSLLAAMLFLTPRGFLNSVGLGWDIMHQFALSRFDIWPNMFVTVGESASIGLKKLIFLTGNYVAFSVAAAGFILNGIRSWRRRDGKGFFRWLFLTAFSGPLLWMALKTERFSVLFVMPLAFFVMFGIDELKALMDTVFERFLEKIPAAARRILPGMLLCLLFLPLPLLMAHLVAWGIKPIMNDAWFETLQEIRQKTPEDAIVNSWWPPGYFLSGVAHRRTTIDGGTQQLHETFWMAKALASEDERESAGILRMLNTGGNRASEYLESLGFETPEAVDLILQVVPLSRAEAFQKLPIEMKNDVRGHFLDLTHGAGALPPTYLFLYNDLIEQNLAVTVAAKWNFKKAREIQKNREKNKTYIQQIFSVLDGVLKYTPEAGLQKREGDRLVFTNGLQVNLATKEALVFIPSQRLAGRPISLFYGEGEQFIEKKYENPGVDMAALLIEEEGTFKSVLADPRLIRSMLFRLYYLGGKGLSLFRPFLAKKDAALSTTLFTYELRLNNR